MTKPEIIHHFDLKAGAYSHGIQRWPWKFLKTREYNVISKNWPSLTNKRALDACCGSGFYTEKILAAGACSCLAIDISSKMLEQIKTPNVEKIQTNFSELKLANPVEFILCAGGLEFASSADDFFKSASRNTSSNGVFMVLYPPQTFTAKFYRAYHLLNGLRIQLFDSSTIDATAIRQGWYLKKRERAHNFADVAIYEKREF